MQHTRPSMMLRRSERRSLRRAVRLDCQVVREHDFKLIASMAVDLSPDGMLVMADKTVLTGEEVVVTFRAPVAQHWVCDRFWFDSPGTIARVVHGRRFGDHGHCLGIKFHDTDLFDRALLARNLRTIPPPLPRRAHRLDYAAMVMHA